MHGARSGIAVAPRRSAGADRRLSRPAGADRGASRRTRRFRSLVALALLATASGLSAQLSAPELEEASETGRRAASALLRGQRLAFEQAIAADAIAEGLLGAEVWRGLSKRQRELVRSTIRRKFSESLEPLRAGAAEIVWSSARSRGQAVLLDLGLRYPSGILKTRWSLERSLGGWNVREIVLSDPGISLVEEAGRALGRGAIERRDRAREALTAALPRAVGLAATLAIVFLFRRRFEPPGRKALYAAALAPLFLFTIDGAFAVRRALSEQYALPETLAPLPWRRDERAAIEAQTAGRFDDARRAWARAVAAGAPAAPSEYRLGVALRAAGRTAEAKEAFARALAGPRVAPGAERELGLLALGEGRSAEARDRLERYVSRVGPDPDTLSALAIARANLGEKEAAVESLEQARSLVADRWGGLALQAQVYAKAGDARKTVETLRAIAEQGAIDREALRSDPVYLPIATDPVWVAFLSETPAPPPPQRR